MMSVCPSPNEFDKNKNEIEIDSNDKENFASNVNQIFEMKENKKDSENTNKNINESEDANEKSNIKKMNMRNTVLVINRELIANIAKQNESRINESHLFASLLDQNYFQIQNNSNSVSTTKTFINKFENNLRTEINNNNNMNMNNDNQNKNDDKNEDKTDEISKNTNKDENNYPVISNSTELCQVFTDQNSTNNYQFSNTKNVKYGKNNQTKTKNISFLSVTDAVRTACTNTKPLYTSPEENPLWEKTKEKMEKNRSIVTQEARRRLLIRKKAWIEIGNRLVHTYVLLYVKGRYYSTV